MKNDKDSCPGPGILDAKIFLLSRLDRSGLRDAGTTFGIPSRTRRARRRLPAGCPRRVSSNSPLLDPISCTDPPPHRRSGPPEICPGSPNAHQPSRRGLPWAPAPRPRPRAPPVTRDLPRSSARDAGPRALLQGETSISPRERYPDVRRTACSPPARPGGEGAVHVTGSVPWT